MIQVLYTGVTGYENINDGNFEQLIPEIMEGIKLAIEKSEFHFKHPSCSDSESLPKKEVVFSVLIDLIPKEKDSVPGESKS